MFKSSANRLEIDFSGAPFAPGDTVSGVIRANRRFKGGSLTGALVYVEQSSDYIEEIEIEPAVELGKGGLETGGELPFTFRLPADAFPSWVSSDPSVASCGRLFWAVVVRGTRWGPFSDRVERHAIPLTDERDSWDVARTIELEQEVTGSSRDWDVDLSIDRWALRRGEEVKVTVTIGKPGPDRDGLDVGIVCDLYYDKKVTSSTADSTSTSRETHRKTVVEERVKIDGYTPVQDVKLTIPHYGPFSYGDREYRKWGPFKMGGTTGQGSAVVVEWKVVVREDKRMRRDPHREARIAVLP